MKNLKETNTTAEQ